MTVKNVRFRAGASAVVLCLALVGCDQFPGGDADGPEGSGSDGEVAGTEEDGDPVTLPPELLECGDPSSTDSQDGLMLAELNLAEASWSMPDGFTETFSYFEDNPVENLVSLWVAEPESDPVTLNVVNVTIYDGLDWGKLADQCGRVPIEAVEERLAGYRDQIGAEPLTDAEMMTLAGHPAIQQSLSLAEYDYLGYWLFSQDQLLHLYCQWTTQQDLIESGCEELVDSLAVD